MARLLADGGMADEARAPLLEASFALSLALAIEARLPAPESIDEALLPPLAAFWGEGAATIRGFAEQSGRDPAAAAKVINDILASPH